MTSTLPYGAVCSWEHGDHSAHRERHWAIPIITEPISTEKPKGWIGIAREDQRWTWLNKMKSQRCTSLSVTEQTRSNSESEATICT